MTVHESGHSFDELRWLEVSGQNQDEFDDEFDDDGPTDNDPDIDEIADELAEMVMESSRRYHEHVRRVTGQQRDCNIPPAFPISSYMV